MKIRKSFNIIVLIILLVSFFGYFRIYQSWVQQVYLLTDMNADNYKRSWEFVDEIITDFPNLTLTSVPIKMIKANYFLYNDSVVRGMELVDEVILDKTNPYLMLPEATKAKYFNTIGEIDSATFYSRKAFNGLPKNPFHYVELSRNFVQRGYIDSLIPYFKKVRYPFQQDLYRLFLASVLPHKDSFSDEDKIFIDDVALEGIKLSANTKDEYNNLLRLTSFMILHGEDSMQQMLELESPAAELLNTNKFSEALIIYKELNQLIPTNFVFKENIALASFNLKDFNMVVKMMDEIEELNHKLTESQHFMLGISLWNTNSKIEGCDRIILSSKMGLEEANNAVKILCANL
jgi:tetratricopeptide (TPR) repeat protein